MLFRSREASRVALQTEPPPGAEQRRGARLIRQHSPGATAKRIWHIYDSQGPNRCRSKREQLLEKGVLAESRGQNLALTVLHVPYLLNSGQGVALQTETPPGAKQRRVHSFRTATFSRCRPDSRRRTLDPEPEILAGRFVAVFLFGRRARNLFCLSRLSRSPLSLSPLSFSISLPACQSSDFTPAQNRLGFLGGGGCLPNPSPLE